MLPGLCSRAQRLIHPSGPERSVRPGVLERHPVLLVLLLGYPLLGLIGLLNYALGPQVSCSIFYLIPIALAAWYGGFAHGILLSLASTILWEMAEGREGPHLRVTLLLLWNGTLRFGFFAITSSLVSRLHTVLDREQALARTDALTGVANGRTFYDTARMELERCRRTRRAFTVAYLDLDNFKSVNDRLGHAAGDDLLRRVARALRDNTRVLDVIARLGGDEFALLLPETDVTGSSDLLARICAAVLAASSQGVMVSCSIGAVTFRHPPSDVDALVQRIDALMYEAKRTGKNRVRHVVTEGPQLESSLEEVRERRVAVRCLCQLPARLRLSGNEELGEWTAVIQDISTHGLGLRCDIDLPEGSLLALDLLDVPSPRSLLARVVRKDSQDRGWFYGCELAQMLRAEELHSWGTEVAACS